MKVITIAFCAICAATAPATVLWADNGSDSGPDAPRSLMEEGARLFFKGLQEEMAPALEGLQALAAEMGPAMQDFVLQMGPAMGEILQKVEDWSQYHAPEMLPNGDIILRKRVPQDAVPDADETGEIEI